MFSSLCITFSYILKIWYENIVNRVFLRNSPESTKRYMHVTFLAPFLWYQLLKLAVDRSSSPCPPNCILFFDNSTHPHQSLFPLQSHWLMALPARQNRNGQQENVCVSQESNREKKIKGMKQHTTKPHPFILSLVLILSRCFLYPAELELSGSNHFI